MFHKLPQLLLVLILVISCSTEEKSMVTVDKIISDIQYQYAPDKRVAWFQVEAEKKGETYILKGESNLPEAVDALHNNLSAKGISILDSITPLPHESLNGLTQGVINVSVANLRSNPKHSAELATQATLGTMVNILKKEGEWYWIQTPDGYLAWVDYGGIIPLPKKDLDLWKNAEKLIYTKTYGHSYQNKNNGDIVSDLVAGDILKIIEEHPDYFYVEYPDRRTAYIKKGEADRYLLWLESLHPTENQLVATAETLMGVPYLWGGTSTKGVDCSGFTKTVYFLNGMVIPRDASQQVNAGIPLDSAGSFENLKKGDLLFFGKKATDSTKEKVVHVGMWIGNNKFIHSAGRVKISSTEPGSDNYDEYNVNRYLRTKRYLDQPNTGFINLKKQTIFKD
ncbi:C40 family peptidase [Flagellimonas onchidii]|uniref:C40 family peptidase n=1 Tax=Flagellimonas onchidii TaxID=2562684 RepID=UPI0010A67BA0|nr:C40 family peptidase [Allomuricauda onchidii]